MMNQVGRGQGLGLGRGPAPRGLRGMGGSTVCRCPKRGDREAHGCGRWISRFEPTEHPSRTTDGSGRQIE
jgi:hypothetical protein